MRLRESISGRQRAPEAVRDLLICPAPPYLAAAKASQTAEIAAPTGGSALYVASNKDGQREGPARQQHEPGVVLDTLKLAGLVSVAGARWERCGDPGSYPCPSRRSRARALDARERDWPP